MASNRSSIAGRRARSRPARNCSRRIWRSHLPFTIKLEATAHLTSNFAYLLLACLCVLLHPSSGGPQAGWVRTLLVDVPIFLTASALRGGLLYLRATGIASAHVDERNPSSCHVCLRWELVFRSTMRAPCSKRFSTTNRTSRARPSTESSANRSPGGAVNTCR